MADAKTTAALEQDGSLRCVLEVKYRHRDRHSVPATAWARRKAERVSRGLLKGAGLEAEADGSTVTLNLVTLGKHHHSSYICFDLYLGRCSSEARDMMDRSTREPIHVISKRGDVFIARRAPRLDSHVAEDFGHHQEVDHGPKPHFSDSENPPLYDMGRRVEDPWRGDPEENVDDDADDDCKDKVEEDEEDLRGDQRLDGGKAAAARTADAED